MPKHEVYASELETPLLLACKGKWYVASNYCNDDGSLSITLDRFTSHEEAYRFLRYKRDEISSEEYFYPEEHQRKLARQARRPIPPRCTKCNSLLLKHSASGAYITECPTCSGYIGELPQEYINNIEKGI